MASFVRPGLRLSSRTLTDQSFVNRVRVVSAMSTGEEEAVRFPLTDSSTLVIQKGDITKWLIQRMSECSEVAAQMELYRGRLDRIFYKRAIVSPKGFRLLVSHVIHTVGPVYRPGKSPAAYLSSAYRKSLILAAANNIQYIAFPAISCGVYAYPYEEAADVALSTIQEAVNGIKEIHFVLFSDDIYNVWLESAREMVEE